MQSCDKLIFSNDSRLSDLLLVIADAIFILAFSDKLQVSNTNISRDERFLKASVTLSGAVNRLRLSSRRLLFCDIREANKFPASSLITLP